MVYVNAVLQYAYENSQNPPILFTIYHLKGQVSSCDVDKVQHHFLQQRHSLMPGDKHLPQY